MAATLAAIVFHKAYEHPTNVFISRNHCRISDTKVTSIVANGRPACRDHDSQGIVKHATTTRHMSTLRKFPSRGITPGSPTQKLLQLSRMIDQLAAIMILKVL